MDTALEAKDIMMKLKTIRARIKRHHPDYKIKIKFSTKKIKENLDKCLESGLSEDTIIYNVGPSYVKDLLVEEFQLEGLSLKAAAQRAWQEIEEAAA